MVRAFSVGLICLGWPAGLALAGPAPSPDNDPTRSVGRAMGHGAFPWYDAPKDAVRAMRVPSRRDRSASGTSPATSRTSSSDPPARPPSGAWDFGSWVSFAGFVLAIGALIGLLVWFWRMYEPSADAGSEEGAGTGEPVRVEELPAGLRLGYDPSDPWAEAVRRRDRGDLAGAVICLFAHQLLTLSRLGLVRLAPGRTARQLLRSVTDAEFRGLVAPTLRLFEAAYYGQQPPSADQFAEAWAEAEAFRRRVAPGVAP